MELIMKVNEGTSFTNKELNTATNAIFKLGNAIKNNLYNVAHIMATVDENKYYEEDGFKNVHEWTTQTFGFKKSASYSLLKIGKEYTRAITEDKNGKVKLIGYGSNLIEETDIDFTTTQVECMLPLGHDTAEQLVQEEVITPEMSCKEIKKIVKAYRNPEEETSSEATEETSGQPENVDEVCASDVKHEILLAVKPDGTKVFVLNGEEIPADDYSRVLEFVTNWAIH